MKDDPFRSLAGELRRAGGFAKDTTPFSEFLWADFLRRRMDRHRVDKHFSAAVKEAMKLAKSQDAHYLPGWCARLTAERPRPRLISFQNLSLRHSPVV